MASAVSSMHQPLDGHFIWQTAGVTVRTACVNVRVSVCHQHMVCVPAGGAHTQQCVHLQAHMHRQPRQRSPVGGIRCGTSLLQTTLEAVAAAKEPWQGSFYHALHKGCYQSFHQRHCDTLSAVCARCHALSIVTCCVCVCRTE